MSPRELETTVADVLPDYLALVDDVEQIPVAARLVPRLTPDERAAIVGQVLELVRDRVGSRVDGLGATVDELSRADVRDGARIKELLYRVHAAIAAPEAVTVGPSRWFG